MPIGIVSDEEFNIEKERGEKSPPPDLRPAQVVDIPRPGRKEGDNNVPDSIRNLIADEAITNGRASALEFAKLINVSPASVSAYSNGATSTKTYHKPNKELADKLAKSKLNISKRAARRLNLALNGITEDKINEAKLTEIALVAKAMSGIIKDMEPPSENKNGDVNFNGPSIVMYNPGFAKEASFDTVELNEAEG